MKVQRKRRRLYEPLPSKDASELPVHTTDEDHGSTLPSESQRSESHKIIMNHVGLAAGTALIPVPAIDLLGITALQLRMLKRLSSLYGLDYREERAKALIAALASGLTVGVFAASWIKAIPFIGYGLAITPLATIAGGTTYALGKAFSMHFEFGGSILDFDPVKMRTYFDAAYREGKERVK